MNSVHGGEPADLTASLLSSPRPAAQQTPGQDPWKLAYDVAQLYEERSPEHAVDRIVQHCASAVNAAGASLALLDRRQTVEIVAATSHEIDAAANLAIDLSEGPALSVLSTGTDVIVDDAAADQRWPDWGHAIAERGYPSLICTPVGNSGNVTGALTIYQHDTTGFVPTSRRAIRLLARHAGAALAGAQQILHLTTAIESRTVIGAARGILMERYSIDGEQAFAVLCRYSQYYNVKLRQVAQHLIDTRRLPCDT